MTNSHLLAGITFSAFALFAALTWAVSYRLPVRLRDPSAPKTTRGQARGMALLLLALGTAMAYFAFVTDYAMRVTTLHEEMVAGSVGVAAGADAPGRTVAFTVEHPGVAHELFLSPTSDLLQSPTSDAEVSFSLVGPDGAPLLTERVERFRVRAASRNRRADWDGKTFAFTPAVAGPHTFRMRTLTPGVPKVQVRVVDPLKKDGERMPGY